MGTFSEPEKQDSNVTFDSTSTEMIDRSEKLSNTSPEPNISAQVCTKSDNANLRRHLKPQLLGTNVAYL